MSLSLASPLTFPKDWARHRKECVPANQSNGSSSSSGTYNGVNMIATPPPAEPQYIAVSAILFSPEEGDYRVSFFPTPF
jgi:hypothetical protein